MPLTQDDYDETDEPRKPRKKDIDRGKRTDDKEGPEASAESFSHYLGLADGNTVRFNVGNEPDAPMPREFCGVEVVSVRHAMVTR